MTQINPNAAPERTLEDVQRELNNLAYELEQMAAKRPPTNGPEISLAWRKAQEAGFYTALAIQKKG